MNRDEIMNMKPGRELDLLVCVKVMEWKERVDFDCIVEDTDAILRYEPNSMGVREFHPSTDISAAFEVEKRIKDIGLMDEYGFQVYIVTDAEEHTEGIRNINVFKIVHATPEQRCKAALLSLIQEDTPNH